MMKRRNPWAAALFRILLGTLLLFSGAAGLAEPAGTEVAAFYQYLRDQVVPQVGLVSGEAVPMPPYKLAETMASRAGGLISAVVCDLDGDGKNELLTVTGGKSARKNALYAWQLNLYGRSPETGEISFLSRVEDALYLETDTNSGSMSVHIQASEGTVYILCDASVTNFTSSAWDYTLHHIYRVDADQIADLTAFESQLRGNTGVSLHRADDESTLLCSASLRWEEGRITDHTRLADGLSLPEGAAAYTPQVLNLADYAESRGVEKSRVDQLVQDLESGVCQVVHLSTADAGNGCTEYVYHTDLNCVITVGARNEDGALMYVQISDAKLYDRSFYLKKISAYLESDMSDALKSLLSCMLRSSALNLTAEEADWISGAELIGTERSDWDRIVFYNRKEETIGGVTLTVEKSVNTAGAGGNSSTVRLTLIAEPEAAPSESSEASDPAPVSPLPGDSVMPAFPSDPALAETPAAASAEAPDRPAAENPEAAALPPSPAWSSLTFTEKSFPKKQTLAVYAAPSTKAWRGANGKAAVSTGGPVWVAGADGKWLLVMYETSGGSVRVGYIQQSKIKGKLPAAEPLAFENLPSTLSAAAEVTDDLTRGATVITSLKAGAEVTFLAVYEDWAYIETKVKKKVARGFIPLWALDSSSFPSQ